MGARRSPCSWCARVSESHRDRAKALVTALVNEDLDLAHKLAHDDPDSVHLAFMLARMVAGFIKGFASRIGEEPHETWQAFLLQQARDHG